jgi:two-component system response regulator FixJ
MMATKEMVNTVHVLDDDLIVRKSLSRLMRSEGFSCHTHENFHSFITSYPKESLGCLLLDYDLGDDDGLNVKTRMNEAGIKMPTIFLTANPSRELREKALALGVVEFLSKTVTANEIINAVKHSLVSATH